MKITFVKDCPPIVESGNSAYKVGTKADLRLGASLIALGYAREGWGKETAVSEPEPKTSVKELTLHDCTDDELKQMAKKAGISSYWNMKRETLIERLSDGD